MDKPIRTMVSMKEPMGTVKDYVLFGSVLMFILLASILLAYTRSLDVEGFMRMFMGVFFLVFAGFKLVDLKAFVTSFAHYDILAKLDIRYAYAYPVIELILAAAYFFNWPFANWATIIILTIGGVGVLQELLSGSKIRCACLGKYIKLPLTTVSLVEDLVMVAMALILALHKL